MIPPAGAGAPSLSLLLLLLLGDEARAENSEDGATENHGHHSRVLICDANDWGGHGHKASEHIAESEDDGNEISFEEGISSEESGGEGT